MYILGSQFSKMIQKYKYIIPWSYPLEEPQFKMRRVSTEINDVFLKVTVKREVGITWPNKLLNRVKIELQKTLKIGFGAVFKAW